MSFMQAVLDYGFMQRALVAILLASLLCGVLGSLVVVNRLVLMAGGISHAAYGGVGLAIFMGWPVLPSVTGFSMATAGSIAVLTKGGRLHSDAVIGILWSFGMATGVLLLDLTPGYNVDLMSYLFGSLLAIPISDLWLMLGIALSLTVLVAVAYPGLVMISVDPEHARSRGISVTALYVILLLMIALGVVVLMRVAGLILVIALLTIPAYMAEQKSSSLLEMMLRATGWSLLFCVSGLVLAFHLGLTTGPAIVAIAAVAFFGQKMQSLLARMIYQSRQKRLV